MVPGWKHGECGRLASGRALTGRSILGTDDRRDRHRRARPPPVGVQHRIAGNRDFGQTIDPAFVEDPLTGGATIVSGRGCFTIRKDKWYDPSPRKE